MRQEALAAVQQELKRSKVFFTDKEAAVERCVRGTSSTSHVNCLPILYMRTQAITPLWHIQKYPRLSLHTRNAAVGERLHATACLPTQLF